MPTRGILYLAFGKKARQATLDSYHSLREHSKKLDAVVVGDVPIPGMDSIPWIGGNPFNGNGRFLGGMVKPFMWCYSPFDETLFMDSDTTILRSVTLGFDFLKEHDIAVANHYGHKTIENCPANAERDATIALVGANVPHINAGVIFFRHNGAVHLLLENWSSEWRAWRVKEGRREWDEQLAFHRAIHNCPDTKVFYMSEDWNKKYKNDKTVIWHEMGSAKCREVG